MQRNEAISIICTNILQNLSDEERYALLLDFWIINPNDEEYQDIPNALKQEMTDSEKPIHEAKDPIYNALILQALKHGFYGVTNEYLSYELKKRLALSANVYGAVEKLLPCNCCHYNTLKKRREYHICPICGWEDDGDDDPNRYSACNKMTLNDARRIFIQSRIKTQPIVDKYSKAM